MSKTVWFEEKNDLWPGQAMTLEITDLLESHNSEFQHIEVYQTKTYGKMLVIDNVIQFTERDEFSYQEMMCHVPLMIHPNPQKVLVIGGGDGGVIREIVKHKNVSSITLCEIDKSVIDISKKYFPNMVSGLEDSRVEIVIKDGFEFLNKHENSYDVIITDSSDPVGPAASLFQKDFFALIKKSLRSGGIVVSQAECIWLHMNIIVELVSFCKDMFTNVNYGMISIPTYPCGQIGFIICSDFNYDFRISKNIDLDPDLQNSLKYYNKDVHYSSFALPQFVHNLFYK